MAQVFLSYASADREQAKRLADAMQTKGYSVWWDRQIAPGRTFDEVIEEALNASSCVVVLWSATSVKSDWVKTEAAEAASRKILVPVLINKVKIPLEFRRLQAADLTQWDGRVDDLEFEKFLRAVDAEIRENENPQTTPSKPQTMSATAPSGAMTAAFLKTSVPTAEPKPVVAPAATLSAPAGLRPKAEAKPQNAPPRSSRAGLMALPVIAILAIVAFLFYNKTDVQTPLVVGMPYESALAALKTAGLAPSRQEEPSTTDSPEIVVAQIPPAGTKLAKAAKVILTVAVPAESTKDSPPPEQPKTQPPVAESQITVPDLKGQTAERAIELLNAAGLKFGVRHDVANNDVGLDMVVGQDPGPTQTLARNSAVSITVAARRKVPELVGLELQKAQAELTRLGLTDRLERVRASRGETDNRVVKQVPAAGLDIEKGGQTQLTITVVSPRNVPGGNDLFKTDGQRCVQICKDSGLSWTKEWSGRTNPPTCKCAL